MKTILALLMVLLSATIVNAQSVKMDKNGNYITVKSIATKDTVAKATGKTFTDSKGVVYPVYITATNRLYIIRTSKNTGNQYKQYLKIDTN